MSHRRPLVAGLLLLASAALTACDDPTQIIVAISTDLEIPRELDALRVEIRQPELAEPVRFNDTFPLKDARALPTTLSLNAGKNPAQPVEILVEGSQGGKLVVRRRARLPFVPQEQLLLRLELLRSCVNRPTPCRADETCVAGICKKPDVDPETLPPYNPGLANANPDAGSVDTVAPDTAGSSDGTSTQQCAAPLPKSVLLRLAFDDALTPAMKDGPLAKSIGDVTLQGNTWSAKQSGAPGCGSALTFHAPNPKSSAAVIPHFDPLADRVKTIELWARFDDVSLTRKEDQILLSRDAAKYALGGYLTIGRKKTDGAIAARLQKSPSERTFACASPIMDKGWHHIAVTYDAASGALKIYVDGVEGAYSGSVSGDTSYFLCNVKPLLANIDLNANENPWTIGMGQRFSDEGDTNSLHDPFIGAIDELRFHDKVLTSFPSM